jgi:glycosyltransferase involved in cell wall biosynthesis
MGVPSVPAWILFWSTASMMNCIIDDNSFYYNIGVVRKRFILYNFYFLPPLGKESLLMGTGKNSQKPDVTVVTATYNRSEILIYSLKSLQSSDYQDWECLVVGDGCTDNTAEVVASLKDPRFRFINLPENFGEQSVPNNHGTGLARGRYIAYLNHDDLWFPNHLSSCIQRLKETGADLVFSIGAILPPDGRVLIRCISSTGKYEPYIIVPASLWVFKREMLQEVGPWRSHKQTRNTPSQDWLWRAWKKKKRIILVPQLTALLPQTSSRKDCYVKRDPGENKKNFHSILADPRFRERILLRALIQSKGEESSISFIQGVKKTIKALFYKIFLALRLPPGTFLNLVRYGWRGGFINYLRKKRGLDRR